MRKEDKRMKKLWKRVVALALALSMLLCAAPMSEGLSTVAAKPKTEETQVQGGGDDGDNSKEDEKAETNKATAKKPNLKLEKDNFISDDKEAGYKVMQNAVKTVSFVCTIPTGTAIKKNFDITNLTFRLIEKKSEKEVKVSEVVKDPKQEKDAAPDENTLKFKGSIQRTLNVPVKNLKNGLKYQVQITNGKKKDKVVPSSSNAVKITLVNVKEKYNKKNTLNLKGNNKSLAIADIEKAVRKHYKSKGGVLNGWKLKPENIEIKDNKVAAWNKKQTKIEAKKYGTTKLVIQSDAKKTLGTITLKVEPEPFTIDFKTINRRYEDYEDYKIIQIVVKNIDSDNLIGYDKGKQDTKKLSEKIKIYYCEAGKNNFKSLKVRIDQDKENKSRYVTGDIAINPEKNWTFKVAVKYKGHGKMADEQNTK